MIDFFPVSGLASGNTKIKISGKGFLPLKNDKGEYVRTPVYIWMIDWASKMLIGKVTQAESVDNENIIWSTPAAAPGTKGIISLSLNNWEFFDIHLSGKDYSFEYTVSPKIEWIEPAFGEVWHSNNEFIDVYGSGFLCRDNNNCWDIKCRFGTAPNFLFLKALYIDPTHIKCEMPNFP